MTNKEIGRILTQIEDALEQAESDQWNSWYNSKSMLAYSRWKDPSFDIAKAELNKLRNHFVLNALTRP